MAIIFIPKVYDTTVDSYSIIYKLLLAMIDRSTGRSGRVKFPTAPVGSGHENPDRFHLCPIPTATLLE